MSRCQPNTSIEQQPSHIFALPTWKYMERKLLSDNVSVIVEVNIIALKYLLFGSQDEHIELFCWRRKLYVKLKSWLHKNTYNVLLIGLIKIRGIFENHSTGVRHKNYNEYAKNNRNTTPTPYSRTYGNVKRRKELSGPTVYACWFWFIPRELIICEFTTERYALIDAWSTFVNDPYSDT